MRAEPFAGDGSLQAMSAHAGLLLEKYLTPFDTQGQRKEKENKRRLRTLENVAGLPVDTAYRQAFRRWEILWSNGGDKRLCVTGVLRSPMAIGMGSPSVLENGLRLHPTYGVPMIPASSIKGALRARMHEDTRNRGFLFGDEKETGEIVFQDALPVPPANAQESLLVLDVITVHHQDYYGQSAAPTDFDSPNPVHFLAVRGKFLFVADAPDRAWRDFVLRLLLDVLDTDGMGGKRSSGYGRFEFRRPHSPQSVTP